MGLPGHPVHQGNLASVATMVILVPAVKKAILDFKVIPANLEALGCLVQKGYLGKKDYPDETVIPSPEIGDCLARLVKTENLECQDDLAPRGYLASPVIPSMANQVFRENRDQKVPRE